MYEPQLRATVKCSATFLKIASVHDLSVLKSKQMSKVLPDKVTKIGKLNPKIVIYSQILTKKTLESN